ncbi:hypothetical protein NXY56_001263 [Leishmania guyanensis]
MVALIRVTHANRIDPVRTCVDCVTAIDISRTQLSRTGPLLDFDDNINGRRLPPPGVAATRLHPDQHMQRGLTLTYVAPRHFIPEMRLHIIRKLLCFHCGFTNADADALEPIRRTGSGQANFFRKKGEAGC